MFRSIFIVAIVLFTHLPQAAQNSLPAPWLKAIDGEHRSDAHKVRDTFRHPYKTLTFFGVTPASTVVEIWPGGGWYSEVIAPLLNAEGVFYAAHFGSDSDIPYYSINRKKFDVKMAGDEAVYGKVITTTLMPPKHITIAPDGSADVVLTFRNVHNWIKSGKEASVFSSMYAALKPGGVLGVVEHRARPDTSMVDMISSGYVTEKAVKQLAVAAGFVFDSASEINANAKDTAQHPKGVWTLPPSLRLGEQQRDHYLAIGESDRMTLKFKKPH